MNKLAIKNSKLIIIIFFIIILVASATYAATTYLYNSNQVSYDNTVSGLTSDNVQGVLDELYGMAQDALAGGDCPDGYTKYTLFNPANGFKCVMPVTFSAIASAAVSDNTSSTYVTASSGVSFSAISSDTNGKGLYLLHGTENDTYPIYYYRGAVDNNHVLFANKCWRIIRTTETGGVKMIYNGVPSSGVCNNTGTASQLPTTTAFNTSINSASYVGYTYDSTANSVIKLAVDNWYASNMTSYTSYLEDTPFCNDRTFTTSSSNTSYGARTRLATNKAPSLACSLAADKHTVSSTNGNGRLTYPVGLITADEVAYAGGHNTTGNMTYYLYTGQTYWTMSPHTYNGTTKRAYEFYVSSTGNIDTGTGVSEVFGVRPVISLKAGTLFASGTGRIDEPLIVMTN